MISWRYAEGAFARKILWNELCRGAAKPYVMILDAYPKAVSTVITFSGLAYKDQTLSAVYSSSVISGHTHANG